MAREPETAVLMVSARITSAETAALWMTLAAEIIKLARDPKYAGLVRISGG